MEKRKLDYLLDKAKTTMLDINKHFQEVDDKMNRVQIGIKMIDVVSGVWDDFPVTIVDIVDKENGIVKVYEESINQHREMSILSLCFEDEPRQMK